MNQPDRMFLNGTWHFAVDADHSGVEQGYFRTDYDPEGWFEVSVPSVYETCLPKLRDYPGVCWYRRTFTCPTPLISRSVLHFEGVNFATDVWLNGEWIGSFPHGYLPFEYDVSHLLHPGENQLAVKVNAARHPGQLPPTHFWRHYGGIIRDVWLEQRPLVGIDDVVIQAEPRPGGHGHLEFLSRLENHLDEEQAGQLVFTVFPYKESASGEGQDAVSATGSASVKLSAKKTMSVPFSCDVPEIAAWSPSAPVLYILRVRLLIDGEIVSQYEHRFGFRRIEVTDGRIVLNGEPVFLVGVNRHEELPGSLMAVNRELARKDLTLIKSLGANFIRMCHYPHDRYELDLCDELGMLVLAEIPLNAYLFAFPFTHDHALHLALPDIEANARQMLDAMIQRDRNHPSVVIWSVSNETGEHIADVRALNHRLIDFARSLDASRLIVHVTLGSTWGSGYADEAYPADDIVCVNIYNYVEEIRSLREAGQKIDPEIAMHFWQDHVARIMALYPGKPVLVTEIGFPVRLPTDQDIQKQIGADDEEQLQADYLELMLSAARPYVAGLSIWAWADHNWPHIWPEMALMFGQSVSTFGLISQDRSHLRKAAEVIRRFAGL